jgi:hypothetical protein
MAFSYAVLRAAIGGAVLMSSVAFTVQFADTAAGANYNKAQCKPVRTSNGLTRGLAATKAGAASVCTCPSSLSAYERRQRRANAASVQACDVQTPQVVRNFNQPPGTPPGTPPGEPPGEPPTDGLAGANPGNHLQVGNATENPAKGTGSLSKFGISDTNSKVSNRHGDTVCCEGGARGASDKL